jgi:hypothetical protein
MNTLYILSILIAKACLGVGLFMEFCIHDFYDDDYNIHPVLVFITTAALLVSSICLAAMYGHIVYTQNTHSFKLVLASIFTLALSISYIIVLFKTRKSFGVSLIFCIYYINLFGNLPR